MKGSGEEPCRWSSLFYHTHDVTNEAEDWWRNSLRQLDLPVTCCGALLWKYVASCAMAKFLGYGRVVHKTNFYHHGLM
ncbi:hypothetical protein E2C01_017511 [Portunus trituberculatus]|uniref:Uncharacterized protein n=1 Tax=Portunus trituberculatus TaxID=210409 RepID=A0A5B7DSN7_PORTR|nr:hypothetical protein [Portunus trituberculatus]